MHPFIPLVTLRRSKLQTVKWFLLVVGGEKIETYFMYFVISIGNIHIHICIHYIM